MKKKILILLTALLLIGIGYGLYQWNKPKRTAEAEKPAAELAAADLFQKFSENETEANAAFLNKVIEVSGKISSIDTDAAGLEVVYLETTDIMGTVSCTFSKGKNSNATPGQDVKIKGICDGFLTDVVLKECALVQ